MQTLRLPPSASAAARLVETVVLPTPPLAEKTVMSEPRGSLDAGVLAVAVGQGDVQGVDPGDRLAETREVSLLDDLAHAGPQRVGQHGRVDAATHQDDAQGGLGHTQRVGQGDPRRLVDRGAEDDGVLARVHVQVAAQLLEAGHDGACLTRRPTEVRPRSRRRLRR